MTLSFIIPTLNEERVLEATLSSIRRLTGIEYEVIVSDGGSADATLAIARRLADRVVENTTGKRQNIAIGRNAGAAIARGAYLVFMDADVTIPDMNAFFDSALKAFDDRRLVGIIPKLGVLPAVRTTADALVFEFFNIFNWAMNGLSVPYGPGECQIVRADAFKKVGGYNEKLVALEDMDLFVRLSAAGRVRLVRSLRVYHTGRRAHKIGWPKLLWQWTSNSFSVRFRGQSVTNEWTVVR
jgi:glycosyltransferase involved in cell wall biosynthesis